jgi:hypothetical protein
MTNRIHRQMLESISSWRKPLGDGQLGPVFKKLTAAWR